MVPEDLAFDLPADLDTPVSAFLKLAPLQPRYLLESVDRGERLARWSFLGFGDAQEAILDERGFRTASAVLPPPSGAAGVAAALREVLDPGRWVGFAGYDLVRRLEKLPCLARPLGTPDGAWVRTGSLLVFDHVTRRAALVHEGPGREGVRSEVLRLLRGPVPPLGTGTSSTPRANLAPDEFFDRVARVKEHIEQGELYQLVLSIAFSGETSLPPFEIYRALRRSNPSPYAFYVQVGGCSVIGASPEALVRLDGQTASLRPIAGTRPRGRDAAHDAALEAELLADPKEAAEHVMLVDLARNDLGRVARPNTIRVEPQRVVERYSHVMHLVSGVQGALRADVDATELLLSTFPAGTVTGAPKIRAMEVIEALEPERRGVYGGTVGYLAGPRCMDQALAIRTLVVRDGTYRYQAGAGLVADSVPEREHAEILAKAGAMAASLRPEV